ncbi:PASTA domain-containing protein [Jatrophihabitans sp. YIM 134969]
MPDVLGMVVDDARLFAHGHGVTLAQRDPDGPPLVALTWQRPVVVTGQDPPAGTPVSAWHTVVVTWAARAGPAGVREPRRPLPRTQPDAARDLPGT